MNCGKFLSANVWYNSPSQGVGEGFADTRKDFFTSLFSISYW
jgi:hypothetical protein